MQTHLALEATTRINRLAEQAAQLRQVGWDLLKEELYAANQRYYSRSKFIEQVLLPDEQDSLGDPAATLRLKSRQQFIEALHQCEREEAILKWLGESPEAIQKWKSEQLPAIEACVEYDPERDAILGATVQSLKINDEELKAAKERCLRLLTEVTMLLEEVRKVEKASATLKAEGDQIDRHANAESLRLSKTYALNLLNGHSQLVAYQQAAATLEGARAMHVKRLDAIREKAPAFESAQIIELLAATDSALSPDVVQGLRDRTEQALASGSLDALSQLRRELVELTGRVEQSKGNAQIAAFASQQYSSITAVINGAGAREKEPGPVWEGPIQRDLDEESEANRNQSRI
jgi:hypothetical protein